MSFISRCQLLITNRIYSDQSLKRRKGTIKEEYLNNIKTLLADKGYDSTQIIEFIKEKYIV